MRLKKMKERRALPDYDSEKRDLTPKVQAVQLRPGVRRLAPIRPLELREKSSRVKMRSEIQLLKQQESSNMYKINVRSTYKSLWDRIQGQRLTSKWFSHWVPRNKIKQSYDRKIRESITDIYVNEFYDLESIEKSNHVPKFELSAAQLLEINPIYHKWV